MLIIIHIISDAAVVLSNQAMIFLTRDFDIQQNSLFLKKNTYCKFASPRVRSLNREWEAVIFSLWLWSVGMHADTPKVESWPLFVLHTKLSGNATLFLSSCVAWKRSIMQGLRGRINLIIWEERALFSLSIHPWIASSGSRWFLQPKECTYSFKEEEIPSTWQIERGKVSVPDWKKYSFQEQEPSYRLVASLDCASTDMFDISQ